MQSSKIQPTLQYFCIISSHQPGGQLVTQSRALQRLLSHALKRVPVMQCYPYTLCQQNVTGLEMPVVFNLCEAPSEAC